MKYLVYFLIVCSCISRMREKTPSEIARERALHLMDSLKQVDMNLNFMGIAIGESKEQIDKAISDQRIFVDTCINDVYIGRVKVNCIVDSITYPCWPKLKIATLNNKIASIELLFGDNCRNERAFDFFVNTFNERYYNEDDISYSSRKDEYHSWWFKNQAITIRKEYSSRVRFDRYDKNPYGIDASDHLDTVRVTYLDIALDNILDARKEHEDSLRNAVNQAKQKERQNKFEAEKKAAQDKI